MTLIQRIVLIAAVMTMAAPAGIASPITIDGNDSDWTGITIDSIFYDATGSSDDNGEPADGYDLDETWYEYDSTNDILNFAFTIADDNLAGGGNEGFSRLYLDTEPGGGSLSAVCNIDYYLEWDLTADPAFGSNLIFRDWTGSGFTVVGSADDADVERDTTFAEWSIARSEVGNPTWNDFTWGFHLDNDTTGNDDLAINELNVVPAPGLAVLMPIGLAAVAVWRRRREDS
jgi:hypothetical protein